MTHGSLFSGIGGFDLAAEWMGWQNLFHCEMNPFGQKVLNHYWPDAELFTDITKSDFTKYANRIDILTGGFPCQPYSHAGKRLGKEDDRHLWPEMLRAIREIQPTWVVGENVSGLISWNDGMVFDEVQTDLEAEGYEVFPVVLPACAVNAPHRRDRVWFIAYSNSFRNNRMHRTENGNDARELTENNKQSGDGWASEIERYGESWPTTNADSNGHELRGFGEDRCTEGESIGKQEQRERVWANDRGIGKQGITSNPESQGRKERQPNNGRTDSTENRTWMDDRFERFSSKRIIADTGLQRQTFSQQQAAGIEQCSGWECFPTQPPVCSRNDGLSPELVGITVSKHRNESIKAYGNAIVPQIAFQIFKAIKQLVPCNLNIER
jgi:DNA (cytosine-5)-methyltransferase 1